jgi:hypothetical protein
MSSDQDVMQGRQAELFCRVAARQCKSCRRVQLGLVDIVESYNGLLYQQSADRVSGF